jgi:hypothetical protein
MNPVAEPCIKYNKSQNSICRSTALQHAAATQQQGMGSANVLKPRRRVRLSNPVDSYKLEITANFHVLQLWIAVCCSCPATTYIVAATIIRVISTNYKLNGPSYALQTLIIARNGIRFGSTAMWPTPAAAHCQFDNAALNCGSPLT